MSAKLIRAQLVARLAASLAGAIPSVSTWECVSYLSEMYVELGWRGPWLRRLTRLLDAGTGLRDAHFIAVSREVAEHNARVLGVRPERVSVIYNAVDPTKMIPISAAEREAKRRELGVAAGDLLLLSVGRLVGQKDHATTVRAMAHVVRSIPHAVLVIAGAGTLHGELQDTIDALGLHDHVRLLGARTDVPALLCAADLFVFASRYEGLGIALMEALGAGLPAISSRIATSLEVADGSAAVRYFSRGDVEDLATTIVQARQDLSALKTAAMADAPRVRERFGPAVMAAQYDRVFRDAARA